MPQYIPDPETGRLIPSGEAQQPRSRLGSWEQRTRQRADTTVGYSRFVRIMKVMLPVVAFSLIGLVIVYSSTGRDNGTITISATQVREITQDRALVAPSLTGTDGRGQPFTVTAKGASQVPGKVRQMTIEDVKADINLQDRSWVEVGAKYGVLDVEGKKLDLTKTINIYSDRGYECHTESARYDFGQGLLTGENPISCQGPLGLISAQRFEGLRDPGVIKFSGGVSTTYFPAARQGEAADAAKTNPEGIAEAVPDDATDTQAVTPTPPNPISPKKR